MKIQKYFRIILIVYAQFLTKNVLILQNVPIPLNCILLIHSSTKCFNTFILILPTHSSRKCLNTSILYTTDIHFHNSSLSIMSISFFSSSDTQKSHHLLGCHAIGINFSFNSFLGVLRFSNLIYLTKSCTD